MNRLLICTLCLTTVDAQQWIRAESGPGSLSAVVYDRSEQRLLGVKSETREAWIFDGVRWQRVLPSGLEQFTNINQLMFSGFDEARGEAVIATWGTPFFTQRTFASRGAAWWGAPGPPDALNAATATDPITNSLMTFGGRDVSWTPHDLTYLRTAQGWTLLTPGVIPPPREGAAMATDRARGRVVLFGGADANGASGLFGDTWEWDGIQWTQIMPATSPAPRSADMAYDPVTQRVVLLGGLGAGYASLPDCWEWDGVQWSLRGNLPETGSAVGYDDGTALFVVTAARANVWRANGSSWTSVWRDPGPASGSYPAFAYDGNRGEAVLVNDSPPGDTWTWNGVWQHRTTAGPTYSSGAAMAQRGNDMVLFGGSDLFNWPLAFYSDTWSWNGTAWTLLQPAQRPPARTWHAMVDAGSHALMFGGYGATGDMADTWSFDGSNWTQLQPATAPSPRQQHALAFDRQRQRAVLFGGMSQLTSLQDTWEWDGVTWSQIVPAHAPAGGAWPAAYDTAAGAVVLADWNAAWSWDGADWSQLGTFPGAQLFGGAAAFDEVRQRLLVRNYGELSMLSPTPADVTSSYLVCGNWPDLRLIGRPALGSASTVHIEGAANTLAAVVYGLQSMSVYLAPGCYQHVSIDATLFGVLGADGRLDLPFAVPFDPALRGVAIQAQAAVFDGGPVFGLSLSGALQIVIGD